MEIWTFLGLLAVGFVAYRLTMELGKRIPILELILLIAGLQWIVGPIIEYRSPSSYSRYNMYVGEATYMEFIVPSYLLFVSVILFGLKKSKNYNFRVEDLNQYSKQGLYIFCIGFVFDIIGSSLPGVLGFFAFILSNFKYAGAIILYYSERKVLKKVFYVVIIFLFLNSILKGLFHDFILWSVFFYMFWALKFKPSVKTKLLTFIIAGFSILTLQVVKSAYRMNLRDGYAGDKLELFFSLMSDAILNNETLSSDSDVGSNVRLNQGWIISAVIDNIPKNQPFLEGETIAEAITASIFPRFLLPDKAEAGGQVNFRRFTGLSLSSSTSMAISIIGEAYGNFGVLGGISFMGIWGFFLVRVWKLLLRINVKHRLLIAFLPIIFLQVIKAETELVVVLNHLVKSSIVVWFFFWFSNKYYNWKI